MKYFKGITLLVLVCVIALAGISLHMNAGQPYGIQEASAVVPGDSNMRNRYVTLSTTPITDLNSLNGISSNVQDQLDAGGTGTLADTKIFIGSSAGVATAQTVGTGHSLTNAGAMTHIANTVSSTDILNATVADDDMAANAITATKVLINTVAASVGLSELGTQVTVESGSILIDTQLIAGFSNDVTLTNSTFSGTTWIINTDAGQGQMLQGVFIRPSQ